MIVFSVYHNNTARITQLFWDGEEERFHFCQSRILNLAAISSRAADISLFIRWRPVLLSSRRGGPEKQTEPPPVPAIRLTPSQPTRLGEGALLPPPAQASGLPTSHREVVLHCANMARGCLAASGSERGQLRVFGCGFGGFAGFGVLGFLFVGV
jgi:hypothetical protein